MTTDQLSPIYLEAEAAARENLDRPNHDILAALLAMGVRECGEYVASNGSGVQAVLPRAARILNPNVYVAIANYPPNVADLMAAIESDDPIIRRFAAGQYFINFPKQDTSWAAPLPDFPTSLVPDGAVVYVPFVDGAAENTTVESVAAAEAKAAADAAPHDATATHPIDSAPVGAVVTITPTGHDISFPDGGSSSRTAPEGDPALRLPVGTVVVNHPEGVTTITIPATETAPAHTSIGARFLDALNKIWHVLEAHL